MRRNLDITALRSFVAVADMGGVTRAATMLNLTQSAVSMQLKRLEESLDATLLDRSGRRIALTAEGERLAVLGRRIIALNDEIFAQMRDDAFTDVGHTGFRMDAQVMAAVLYDFLTDAKFRAAVKEEQATLKGLLAQYHEELRKAYAGEMQGPPIGGGGVGR